MNACTGGVSRCQMPALYVFPICSFFSLFYLRKTTRPGNPLVFLCHTFAGITIVITG